MANYGFFSTDDIRNGRRSSHDFEHDSAELGDRTATWLDLSNQSDEDDED